MKKYNVNKENIILVSFNTSVRKKNAEDLKERLSVNNFFGTQAALLIVADSSKS